MLLEETCVIVGDIAGGDVVAWIGEEVEWLLSMLTEACRRRAQFSECYNSMANGTEYIKSKPGVALRGRQCMVSGADENTSNSCYFRVEMCCLQVQGEKLDDMPAQSCSPNLVLAERAGGGDMQSRISL
jgi:hypothetical protein